MHPRQHLAKILALSEVHGCDKIARAIEDSFEFQAFSSDYIANILQQRERFRPEPGPLHLTSTIRIISSRDRADGFFDIGAKFI